MRRKQLYILLLMVMVGMVSTQNEDELHIPMEPDNQFPPDQAESDSVIDGSGDGVVDNPEDDITTQATPKIEENIQVSTLIREEESVEPESNTTDLPCPKPCVCHTEGDSEDFVVDCSGYGLTELPSPIDPRTTTLKLHNNKLTEIPKAISELKKLKVLIANDNTIMDLALGSVSELPELVTLKLANNLLLEYPKDLKNSLSLNKLEELDIGGNDIRAIISPEVLSNFESLHRITLPERAFTIALDLCSSLKGLESVCTDSCKTNSFDCPNGPQGIEDDLLDATLPGMIPYEPDLEDTDSDPAPKSDIPDKEQLPVPLQPSKVPEETPVKAPEVTIETAPSEKPNEEPTAKSKVLSANEFSLRTAIDNESHDMLSPNAAVVNTAEVTTSQPDVKVGATVDVKRAGGVDKSVIGIIVAGMIVIVAVITIKKNWSSIKKRFSSTPRPSERAEGTANGTAPEEVPLQDKSPV